MNESTEPEPGPVNGLYEPPAIVVLGSIASLTAATGDDSSLGAPSDQLLKRDIDTLGDALERLRAIRTR